jgi:hypothetical protein
MSEAQKAAFQRAQEKRMANIETIRAKKEEVKKAEKVSKLTKKVAELKGPTRLCRMPEATPDVEHEEDDSEADTEIIVMPRKAKKKKRIVVVQQSDTESEEEEIVIQKPKAAKAKPKATKEELALRARSREGEPVLKHSPTMPNMYFV